ncbi:MAG: hypothetical protein AMS22_05900 [Thiotrichales bacterium SG8_50]|nr:MAG: hypothetical protein AMS22_05900 [Thiotrichales bacterium SG8_50]
MKNPLYLVILGGLILGVGAYVYFDPSARAMFKTHTRELIPSSSTTLYKWQDSSGRWHVEDTPPAPGIPFEVLDYRHDANVMPAPQPRD